MYFTICKFSLVKYALFGFWKLLRTRAFYWRNFIRTVKGKLLEDNLFGRISAEKPLLSKKIKEPFSISHDHIHIKWNGWNNMKCRSKILYDLDKTS